MKNKLVGILFASVAVLALSGCGGGSSNDSPPPLPPEPSATTLFLIDQDGSSLGGVPYICDSMIDWSETRPNGEFTFFEPESCEFDFIGYLGNYNDDPYVDDIIYIVDYLDDGKGNIAYDCNSFIGSTTYGDGSFDYDIDDQCRFYF